MLHEKAADIVEMLRSCKPQMLFIIMAIWTEKVAKVRAMRTLTNR